MKYTVIYLKKVFYTKWFDPTNHFVNGMIVVDNENFTYTVDGKNWEEVIDDNL